MSIKNVIKGQIELRKGFYLCEIHYKKMENANGF